jgi:phosphoglycerol transferase MdoB-like AlkP superfamily enzyme
MTPITDKLPRLHLFTLAVIALLLLLQTVLRAVFWLKFHNPDDPATLADLVWSFYLGFKFDLRVAIYAVLPLLLLGWIRPLHPVYSRSGRKLWLSYTTLTLLALLLFYATDFGHYAYLEQRLNATALRFLENPLISATMVWETYPVITGALLLLLITAGCMYALWRITARITPRPGQYGRWYQRTAVVILTFFIVVFAGYGKLSWYPLRWSDAFFSTHAFIGQLASNPVLYFFNTLKNRKDTYDIEQVRKVYPLMAQYLGVENPNVDKLDYSRWYHFDATPADRSENLVIVFLESFASYKTGLSGNPLDPTPNIDRLAREGYYWKNFFVTQTGTARSVWTLVTGIPDVEKNKTSSRNPLIVDQYTIINSFDEHKKFYFLGGSASWANIRGLLSANIPRLDIHEEGSYESPRVDVWGISDLSLFEEANKVFKKLDEPFVAIIQTSGNHRPYTIPEYNAGFVEWTQADLKHDVTDYGFASLEELNSFRFMDHSIGHFIDIASKEAYFNDTLFVFFGDHGIHANTGKHVPKSEAQLGIQGLRVPLVMYGKGIIRQPRVFDETASQVDVLPTVAAITRTSYLDTTFGRDLLDKRFDDTRYAFTIEHGLDRVIGLLSDKYYLQMHYDGSGVKLHRLDSDSARDDVSAQHPDITSTMTDYLTAMRYTIPYMREHNKHEDARMKKAVNE